MQPLITVDHESRHSSHHTDNETPQATEDTPLLRRFPPLPPGVHHTATHFTTAVVSLLLIILISGVVIGVYLLIVQNNSENILPPLTSPLQFVSRSQWDTSKRPFLAMSPSKARHVIVVQTDTESCHSTQSCAALLQTLQSNSTKKILPYNFVVSSNGETYEALGWRRRTYLFPVYSASSLVLGFIGNFTRIPPTKAQMDEVKNLCAVSVSLQYLEPSYTIIGKRTKEIPEQLFASFKAIPQWDNSLSDS
ncbi:peptidoglycan-recognition protein 2-like [Hyposmocoma kahamanoa]|uniref:peptidoglycan-recognition protein 2-like n=1 Tax=Hyposmocoma kahamanoa TaxID=1477025 RepID=UPI000E6D7C7F|nr:peptidoglycan-recognition protein 2-like [Hyposmocoma kahamanoa]